MSPPLEMAAGLIDAGEAWGRKYTSNAKLEQIWGFAAAQGGGGICNVNSLEELDEVMQECPFLPFSDIEVYGLVDYFPTVKAAKRAMMAMAAPG